jgi:hypothetical protein
LFSTLGCRLRTLRRHRDVTFVIARWVIQHSLPPGRRADLQPA